MQSHIQQINSGIIMNNEINICRLCLDIQDPLEDGIYIIYEADVYRVIIVEDNKTLVDNTYIRKYYSLEDIIDQLIHNEIV